MVSNFEIANYFSQKGCTSHPLHTGGGNTFPYIEVDPKQFIDKVNAKGGNKVLLALGESYEVA